MPSPWHIITIYYRHAEACVAQDSALSWKHIARTNCSIERPSLIPKRKCAFPIFIRPQPGLEIDCLLSGKITIMAAVSYQLSRQSCKMQRESSRDILAPTHS